MVAKIAIEPSFEADFQISSYGFRPKKSAIQALEAIREAGNRGYSFVVDVDIQSYFDSINKEKLMRLVQERLSDRRVLKLIRQWLGPDLGAAVCLARDTGSVCARTIIVRPCAGKSHARFERGFVTCCWLLRRLSVTIYQ